MAESKPVKAKQVYDPKLFDPLKKELLDVDSLLKSVNEELKNTVSVSAELAKNTPLDSYDNLEKVEKGLKDAKKAVTELDKVEKDRLKLQERLKDLEDDRAKGNFELRESIRRQAKELRDNAKAAADSTNAYEKLKRATNEAQLEGKKLAAEFGVNSEQAKEATARFNKLDEELGAVNKRFKDGRRDVGRYEQGVGKLTKAFKVFASATIVLKILELLQNSISQNSEGAARFEKIWVRLTTVIEVTARRIVEVFPIIQARFERFVLSARISFAEIIGLFKSNGAEISKLKKEYEALGGEASKDLGKAFSGLGAEITDLTNKKVKLIEDTLKYRREIVGLEQDIADLIPTQEKLRAEFENDSASLEEQVEAGVALQIELQKRFKIEEEIASRRLKLAQDNAAANEVNVEAQEELSAATIEYNQLIAEQVSELASNEREIQKLRDDTTQLNLDFYVDDFDNRKTVNERIIADETQTFERRRELLEENRIGAEKANDLRADALNKSLRERGKAELDFEELRKKRSSEEIARVIRESGISEPLAIRALEIIRERRVELQDNAEAQRDLNASESESRLLQDDIALQMQALNSLQKEGVDLQKVLQTLTEARLQSEIDNLRDRIVLAEEGSAEFIALNKELNDKLLDQNQQRADKEKQQLEDRKKALQDFTKGVSEGFQLLSDLSNDQSEKRIAAIDSEIEAEENRANRLQELAAQGNEDAENNLAVTEQRQAELELKRKRQLERQERQELAFAAVQAYSSKVEAGDPNPLAATISDISVLRAFINSLPGFYEGTEMVGDELAPVLPGKDGHIIRVDGSERILKGEQNRIIGKMSNAELTAIAHRENTGGSNGVIVRELQELKEVTKSKPVYLGSDYDKIAGAVVDKIQRGNTLEKRHKKSGGIWG